jgi:hypothetical protein
MLRCHHTSGGLGIDTQFFLQRVQPFMRLRTARTPIWEPGALALLYVRFRPLASFCRNQTGAASWPLLLLIRLLVLARHQQLVEQCLVRRHQGQLAFAVQNVLGLQDLEQGVGDFLVG